jgi:hypothetical protein
MAQISLNYDECKRILDNADAAPDARVIAASAIALFEASRHADDISSDTRAITLKLAHNIASEMYREVD